MSALFTEQNYDQAAPFSSFLPGIAGLYGKQPQEPAPSIHMGAVQPCPVDVGLAHPEYPHRPDPVL